jgi:hypothetical protein
MSASSRHETATLEKTMDMDDKELFSSAMTDEPISDVATEAPAPAPAVEPPQQDDRPRDEHGRFAPKQAEPTPPPEPEAAAEQQLTRDDGGIPAWRLREMREERNAERQRSFELQRQLEMLQQQMPKPEPKPAPDPYERPDEFARYHAQEAMSPLEQRLQAAEARAQAAEARAQEEREFRSRESAFQQYGEPSVREAYDWMANGVRSQTPEAAQIYNRIMQSMHPYDAMVKAFKQVSLVQQIEAAGGPDKWREQQLVPQQQTRQQSNGQPQGRVNLPPSLRNTPSARSGNDDDSSDTSDAALFRHAMR